MTADAETPGAEPAGPGARRIGCRPCARPVRRRPVPARRDRPGPRARGREVAARRTLDAEERQALVLACSAGRSGAADGGRGDRIGRRGQPGPGRPRAASAAGARRPSVSPTPGLNEGLLAAAALGRGRRRDGAILVLPADLPAISRRRDRRRRGGGGRRRATRTGRSSRSSPTATGGARTPCSSSPPDAIPFAFGGGQPGRATWPRAAAAGAGVVELDGPLALDLDTPEDLAPGRGARACSTPPVSAERRAAGSRSSPSTASPRSGPATTCRRSSPTRAGRR